MNPHFVEDDPSPEKQTTQPKAEQLLHNLEQYMIDGQKADVLYDHQKTIFQDTAEFLRRGETRGYIDSPTGTGKTVLFVSLAEAFSYQESTPPRILVVTPTKDLVRQTQGGLKGDKGFAGFAPDLQVGTYYGDTPSEERHLEDQITITTYASLQRLAAKNEVEWQDGHLRTSVVNQVNKLYDIIFLDEGHKALGPKNREIIEQLDDEKIIIGFSATPEYSPSRRLDSLLPTLIHKLELKEAIEMEMLSPIIPLAVHAPGAHARELTVSPNGDYEVSSLQQLLYDPARNDMIVDIAAQAIQDGNTPIIACIPGSTMAHPHMIADQLSQRTVMTADGEPRAVRAKAVTGSMSGADRQQLYGQLESGEIDALAYIDVLTEGWDSQRANVIVNARPTRSLVAARQRMGRILRQKKDNRPAIAVDIIDEVTAHTAPQVSMADILSLPEIISGDPIGRIDPSFANQMAETISRLSLQHGYIERVGDDYNQYATQLESLPTITSGKAQLEVAGTIRTFATADRLFREYGIDNLLLEHLQPQGIKRQLTRSRSQTMEAFDEARLQALVATLPDGVNTGQYLIEGERRYLSLEDVVGIIHRKYKQSSVTYWDVEAVVKNQTLEADDLRYTRHLRTLTHQNVPLYAARTMLEFTKAQAVVGQLRGAQPPTDH